MELFLLLRRMTKFAGFNSPRYTNSIKGHFKGFYGSDPHRNNANRAPLIHCVMGLSMKVGVALGNARCVMAA